MEKKVNENGVTMSAMFKINQENVRLAHDKRMKELKRKQLYERVMFSLCTIGVLAMLIIGLNSQYNSSIEKCVNAGHELDYCERGLK